MILLDTNALIWMLAEHKRAETLKQTKQRLYLSPVSILELQFLLEVGRLKLEPEHTLADIVNDPRWTLDSPPSDVLFGAALDLGWTRDPFDRLLVAHTRCRRWILATGDKVLQTHLASNELQAL